ncbi:hypothetical protein R75465_04661 [Paraburkholderia aspalathi]|uniref:hypothetical protein n=1 Tax=Paraburkholderia aspalathi TaxID=1324617 RepID=UPI001B213263|nr:hypothetical protein [Paraburkholderia aspalathi]CAE6794677.1 hypothetical protein R75465_04661 [Paraburkholderia aspalathi]
MSAIPCSLELQWRCCTSDAGALPANAIRMCCDEFRLHMDQETRQWRFAPAVVIGPFVLLVVLTLAFGFLSWLGPMVDCFVGVVAWIVIFYGLSGQMHGERMRSANLLRAGRMLAWATMLGRHALSFRHVIEVHVQIVLNMLPVLLGRLCVCLKIRLGLIDPSLTVFRLVPPEAARA